MSIPSHVAQVLATYPAPIQARLNKIRKWIFEVASDICEIEETLKWGEPSYLPIKPKTGTTIRLAWKPSTPAYYGIYFNCKTTLIASFRKNFPTLFHYEGKRAIILHQDESIDEHALKTCLHMALTYHLRQS